MVRLIRRNAPFQHFKPHQVDAKGLRVESSGNSAKSRSAVSNCSVP
jgi:hypothetical protein